MGKDADYLNIKGFCGSVENTVQIRDVFYHNTLTSATSNWIKVDNNTNYSFSDNGLSTQGTTGGCYLKLDETIPTNCSIEFTIKGFITNSGGSFRTSYGIDNTWTGCYTSKSTIGSLAMSYENEYPLIRQVNDVIKIVKEGTLISYYTNDVLLGSVSTTTGKYTGFFIRNVSTSGTTIKDIIIHEL